jgi:cell division protein FtsI/penicillin-binding protein 2
MEPNVSSQPTQPAPEISTPTQPNQSTPSNPSSKTKYIMLATLILLILFVLGGGIYYLGVVKRQSTSQKNNNLATATITPIPTSNSNLTTNLTSYTSDKGKFSLKYPSAWVQPLNKEFCNPGMFDRTIYLGPDNNSVMRCATSYGGQMYVMSLDNDVRVKEKSDEGLTNMQTSIATVSGVTGERIEAIYSGLTGWAAGFNGAKIVRYIFYTNSITYVANYIQEPKGTNPSQDVLTDFELMVKTLIFTQ